MMLRIPGLEPLTRRGVLHATLFVLFLMPLTVGEISANYAFVLLPLGYLAVRGSLPRAPQLVLGLMALFTVILLLGFLVQPSMFHLGPRRIGSFVLFMTIFSYAFLRIDAEMVNAFKTAVVVISAGFAVSAIRGMFEATRAGLDLKEAIGSQRFGFVYALAFWIVLLSPLRGFRPRFGKYVLLVILGSGLLLTFSRSSVVALAMSLVLYMVAHTSLRWRVPSLRIVATAVTATIVAVAIVAALAWLVPSAFAYFGDRFVRMADWQTQSAELANPDASDGTRIYLARSILAFVAENPLTGSGFLGIWILPVFVIDRVGSAHNQYLDVLLRTGVVGFAGYLYMLFRVTRHLGRADAGLCWGFVGVLAYGLFHETFKESHGAFILAFLIGMLAQGMRGSRDTRDAAPTGSLAPSPATG